MEVSLRRSFVDNKKSEGLDKTFTTSDGDIFSKLMLIVNISTKATVQLQLGNQSRNLQECLEYSLVNQLISAKPWVQRVTASMVVFPWFKTPLYIEALEVANKLPLSSCNLGSVPFWVF
jgi:hypothetical protein